MTCMMYIQIQPLFLFMFGYHDLSKKLSNHLDKKAKKYFEMSL